jgi:hypothetical protein
MSEHIEPLVTVKTYPIPSTKASVREHVCIAGVTRAGQFIRLWPMNFRYRPLDEWFHKYQWINIEVQDGRAKHDSRPESRNPLLERPIILGETIGTEHNWRGKKRFVLACGVETMCRLRQYGPIEKSLGITRPKAVECVKVEPADPVWKPSQLKALQDDWLLGPKQKPLEKIPYSFSFKFTCEEAGCRGHEMEITDWEIGQLYRRMRDKYKSEDVATEKVRQKLFDELCAPGIDTHLFVGTMHTHPKTWIILGVFYPKKPHSPTLFHE